MDVPYRTFSDTYRGQTIHVVVVCPPDVPDVTDFILQVSVTLHKKPSTSPINVCGRGYESFDEAHHAGILIGQGMIDSLNH
ncbi:MAG: Uncharacterized protein JWP42_3610 [Pseudomonas sp.]|nr:Uncharacterized protein [Pseudomonas sp.]